MPCKHKFLNFPGHNNLLPQWDCNTIIIGTFNPENFFCASNQANFFYQRSRNYFWDVIPLIFSWDKPIDKQNTTSQLDFLQKNQIAITDLLLEIRDAHYLNKEDVRKISSVKDNEIETFQSFHWNTNNILTFIEKKNIATVFFTKIGTPNSKNPKLNSFEYQIRKIESFCNLRSITTVRLHSPTGMGLGRGKRIPTLYNRWSAAIKKNQV